MSIDFLHEKICHKNNPTVAGLDPRLAYVPEHLRKEKLRLYGPTLKAAAESVLAFNKGLIDALADIVPAVKPQSAYYELLGWEGVRVLEQTITYAQSKGLYVIADVKRGDIGSTAQAYAEAYLGETEVEEMHIPAFGADGITVNPYLGSDGVLPFARLCAEKKKSVFILVKTSNPSSGELQDRMMEERPLYERVAALLTEWSRDCMTPEGWSELGAVVGATWPEQQARLRALLPRTYFLVPGYGAQGASAKDICSAFLPDGTGAIVNSSRAIMCAYKKTGREGADYAEAARAEAIRMRDEILSVIG